MIYKIIGIVIRGFLLEYFMDEGNLDETNQQAELDAEEFKAKYEANLKRLSRMGRLIHEVDANRDKLVDFPEYLGLLDETLALCREMRPSVPELEIIAQAMKPSNKEMTEWKKASVFEYNVKSKQDEKKMEELRQRVGALESIVIEDHLPMALDFVIHDPKLANIPFVYYGLNTNRVIYTPATLGFLGIDGSPETMSLKKLLSYIKRDKRQIGDTKRKADVVNVLFTSLRKGKHLNHQRAETIHGKAINLMTCPFYLGSDKEDIVGIGIYLNEPRSLNPFAGVRVKKMNGIIGSYIKSLGNKIYGR